MKKDKPLNRFYHQLTTHYNGYFNAREILHQREKEYSNNYKYNYEELLPIFLFPSEEESKGWIQDMDKVIEKCNKVIVRHSMFINKKEKNKWIDESYLLLAKAHLYKHDFPTAKETYEFVAQNYKGHPARIDALLGIIQCYLQTKQYSKANNILNLIENDEKITLPQQKVQYNAIVAEYYLTKNAYEKAYEYLEKAVVHEKDKRVRARWTFLLAQLAQRQGNYKEATRHFTSVIYLKPGYEMEFQAKLFRAIYYDVAGGDVSAIKKELLKMLVDKKNTEYRDQIYFALAELSLRENNETQAMEYFAKAASVGNNKKIKWKSYLKLGEYYFKKNSYELAAAYYDSCFMIIDKNHPDYFEIEEKTASLKNLVNNIRVIREQDSLLRLSTLPEKEITKIIHKIIEEARAKEEEKTTGGDAFAGVSGSASIQAGVEWYFYNPSALGFGFSEFKKRWGDRVLEDNWRRSNKMTVLMLSSDSVQAGTATAESEKPLFTEEYYRKNIPFTEKQKAEAHGKILEAYNNLGFIYKENFNDLPRAAESFEQIAMYYDTSSYAVPAYYQLFRIYQKMQQFSKAEYYKNLVLEKAPYSDYARLINDPEYLNNRNIDKKRVENYYAVAYEMYKKGDFYTCLNRCNNSFEQFPDNHIMDKFSFLRVLCLGKRHGYDTLKVLLESFIKTYPQSEEKPLAEKILQMLNQQEAPSLPTSKPSYYHSENEDFYFVALLGESANMNNIKTYFSNFNTVYYSQKQLSTQDILFNEEYHLLQIKPFPNYTAAMDYYKTVKGNKDILKYFHQADPIYFVISKSNYIQFYKEKDWEGYLSFFEGIIKSQ